MHRLALISRDCVFSTRQARAVGHDASSLERLRRAGDVVRLAHGWWAVRHPGEPVAPWQVDPPAPAQRHLHRLRAIALGRGFEGRALPSHQSALLVHGVATYRCDLDVVHLTTTGRTASRRGRGYVIHRYASVGQVLPGPTGAVPLAHAVVQTGVSCGPMAALVAADDALHRQLMTQEELDATMELYQLVQGAAATRRVLALADGRHESPGESVTALALRGARWAASPQVVIPTQWGAYRVDFLLDDWPVVIEFDGAVKYAGATGQAALVAEKRREDHLRQSGYEVVRLTWADVHTPGQVARLVLRAVDRARARNGTAPAHETAHERTSGARSHEVS